MVQMFMRDLKKVSALWSVRFRVSALERFCYKRFLRNSSGAKFFVRRREVSALEDVRLREVPLYLVTLAHIILTSLLLFSFAFFRTGSEEKEKG